MASDLWLPGAREVVDHAQLMVDDELGKREWLDGAVRAMDPALSVVFARENADHPSLIPGRWHVRRDNGPGLLPSFMPITTPDGGYRSPDSGVLDELRNRNMWNGDVARKLMKQTRLRHEAAERARARDAEARRGEIASDVKALINPGIRYGGSWTAKAGKAKA